MLQLTEVDIMIVMLFIELMASTECVYVRFISA